MRTYANLGRQTFGNPETVESLGAHGVDRNITNVCFGIWHAFEGSDNIVDSRHGTDCPTGVFGPPSGPPASSSLKRGMRALRVYMRCYSDGRQNIVSYLITAIATDLRYGSLVVACPSTVSRW